MVAHGGAAVEQKKTDSFKDVRAGVPVMPSLLSYDTPQQLQRKKKGSSRGRPETPQATTPRPHDTRLLQTQSTHEYGVASCSDGGWGHQ